MAEPRIKWFAFSEKFNGKAVCPAIVLALLSLCSGGCVERRMTIRTNPPGALVYVDDYEIGTTPVSTNFTYYGKRKIRIVKDGYETLTVLQPVPAPWYEYMPADFIAENLVPGKIRDQRTLDYQLKPQMVMPTDQLLSRAEGLRQTTHGSGAGRVAPAGMTAPQQMPPNVAEPIPTGPPQGQYQYPIQTQPAIPPQSQPQYPYQPGYQSPAQSAPQYPAQQQYPAGGLAPNYQQGAGAAPSVGSQPMYQLPN